MRFLLGLITGLVSLSVAAGDCHYDASRPHVEITHISTAVVVGDEHNTRIRVDATGCLEVRFPRYHKRAGTHTARIPPGQAKSIERIVEGGRLQGISQDRLRESAKSNHLEHLLDEAPVMDASITEVRVAHAGGKRLGPPVRVEALLFRDVRPLAVEWHALQDLTRTVGALADAAASGTLDAANETSKR
jgi:hypothetical protein